MSMMVSFVLSVFPRDVLDEILNLIESVSEDFPSYSFRIFCMNIRVVFNEECVQVPKYNVFIPTTSVFVRNNCL